MIRRVESRNAASLEPQLPSLGGVPAAHELHEEPAPLFRKFPRLRIYFKLKEKTPRGTGGAGVGCDPGSPSSAPFFRSSSNQILI